MKKDTQIASVLLTVVGIALLVGMFFLVIWKSFEAIDHQVCSTANSEAYAKLHCEEVK